MRARIEATGRADLVQPDNPFESTPGLFFFRGNRAATVAPGSSPLRLDFGIAIRSPSLGIFRPSRLWNLLCVSQLLVS